MKKSFILFGLINLISVTSFSDNLDSYILSADFADDYEYSCSYISTMRSNDVDNVTIESTNYDNGTIEERKKYSDTYIPIPVKAKQGVYWSLKSLSWSMSTTVLLLEFIGPVTEGKANELIYDQVFRPWCHQWNSRTWQYSNGNYMPLCQRCTGINVGVFTGHFDSFIWDSFLIKDWERWQQGLLHIGVYSLLILPMYIDGKLQWEDPIKFESTPTRRFITGFLFGYAVTAIVDEMLQLVLDYEGDIKK
jgi:uncharacterized membrane protein